MKEMTLPSRHKILKFEPWGSEAEHATSRSPGFQLTEEAAIITSDIQVSKKRKFLPRSLVKK